MKGGLKGCVYNVTKSGWFDSACFQQWFVEIFMKTVAEKPGKYVLLGDNLALHFNLELIKTAQQNDVYFAMLPPNATHLLQPLDVCVFWSMKGSWRKILQEWKREVRIKGSFNKQFFPSLLKRLINPQSGSILLNAIWNLGFEPPEFFLQIVKSLSLDYHRPSLMFLRTMFLCVRH